MSLAMSIIFLYHVYNFRNEVSDVKELAYIKNRGRYFLDHDPKYGI